MKTIDTKNLSLTLRNIEEDLLKLQDCLIDINPNLSINDSFLLKRTKIYKLLLVNSQKLGINQKTLFQSLRISDLIITEEKTKYQLQLSDICIIPLLTIKEFLKINQNIDIDNSILINLLSNNPDINIADLNLKEYSIKQVISQYRLSSNFYDFNSLFYELISIITDNQCLDKINKTNNKVNMICCVVQESLTENPIKLGLITLKAAIIIEKEFELLKLFDDYFTRYFSKEELDEYNGLGNRFIQNFMNFIKIRNNYK